MVLGCFIFGTDMISKYHWWPIPFPKSLEYALNPKVRKKQILWVWIGLWIVRWKKRSNLSISTSRCGRCMKEAPQSVWHPDGLHLQISGSVMHSKCLILSLRSEFSRQCYWNSIYSEAVGKGDKSKNRLGRQLPNPMGLGSLFFEERVLNPLWLDSNLERNCMCSQSGSSTKNQLLSLCSVKPGCSICKVVHLMEWDFVTRRHSCLIKPFRQQNLRSCFALILEGDDILSALWRYETKERYSSRPKVFIKGAMEWHPLQLYVLLKMLVAKGKIWMCRGVFLVLIKKHNVRVFVFGSWTDTSIYTHQSTIVNLLQFDNT